MMVATDGSNAEVEREPLPPDISELLIEMGTSVQRHAIYPRAHPMLRNAVEGVLRKLDGVLRARGQITLGITREQIVVDGRASNPQQSVIRDLAGRLHNHHLGVLTFLPGLRREELQDLLLTLAMDPGVTQIELGALFQQLERWPHVRLTMLSFDRLTLTGEDARGSSELTEERAESLWLTLASAACGASGAGEQMRNSAEIARAINESLDDHAPYDQAVVGCFFEITDALRSASGIDAENLMTRVAELLRSLAPDTLRRLLSLGGSAEQRRQLVMNASSGLPVDAVLTLVQSAATASGQTISHAMLRLLAKLALQAEEGGGGATMRAGASATLREQIRRLVVRWDTDLANPASYQMALDRVSRMPMLASMSEREYPCEPRRLIAVAIESDATGAAVWRATAEMLRASETSVLLDLLDRAPDGCAVALEMWPRVATPDIVRRMLQEEQVDLALLDRLTTRMGAAIVEPLLDALEVSEARATRRKVLDLLNGFGDMVGPLVVSRLDDSAPWYVLRNQLAVLHRLPSLPAGFAPMAFLGHRDSRVRREALKVLLRIVPRRDDAVCAALADSDERVMQMALTAAGESCPRAAPPLVMRRLDNGTLQPRLQQLAVRVIAIARTQAALEWLLAFTMTRRRWFRRRRLAPKSPEMLTALAGLATVWARDPRATAVVSLASRDPDADIRAAIATDRVSARE